MPRYDFGCKSCGRTHEALAGYGVKTVPCPTCGYEAKRAFYCEGVALHGETVVKAQPCRDKHPALDKHGRIDMDRVQEAQDDMLRHCRKTGQEPPDLLAHAKARVKRGEVERGLARV